MLLTINLEKYLERIAYSGTPAVDLKSLKKLQQQHVQHIAFENFNPLLGLKTPLDLASLEEKMVFQDRGGYCFEHNILFLSVLKQIGFKARGITGRVILRKPNDHINRRTHMLVLVNVNGEDYICDTGFGSSVLPSPIMLHTTKAQVTTHENYRILPYEDSFLLQMEIQQEWQNLYKFYLQKQYLEDYKLANYYTSTHPNSHFTTDLTVTLVGDKKRMALRNNRFVTHHLNGPSQKETLPNLDQLLQVLNDVFHITPPQTDNLKPTLRNLLKKHKE